MKAWLHVQTQPFDAFLSSLCWGYWRVSQAKKSVIPKPVQSKAGKSGERQIFLPCPTIVADHLWSEGCLAKFKPFMSTMLLSSVKNTAEETIVECREKLQTCFSAVMRWTLATWRIFLTLHKGVGWNCPNGSPCCVNLLVWNNAGTHTHIYIYTYATVFPSINKAVSSLQGPDHYK